jgi:hypothetical protein
MFTPFIVLVSAYAIKDKRSKMVHPAETVSGSKTVLFCTKFAPSGLACINLRALANGRELYGIPGRVVLANPSTAGDRIDQ